MLTFKSVHAQLRARILRKIRDVEIELVLQSIRPHIGKFAEHLNVLEFGAGDCYQAKQLARLGAVIASDSIVCNSVLERSKVINFVAASMQQAPFKTGTFDLVFSNHVLEHLSDVKGALSEVKRIAKPRALFAFTVPTRFWLLLAQPAELGWRIAWLRRSLGKDGVKALCQLLRLGGHGEFRTFSEAYEAFSIPSWTSFLERNGFDIVERIPLLAYAPSELLLPPCRGLVSFGLCSSMLFVLRNAEYRDGASQIRQENGRRR